MVRVISTALCCASGESEMMRSNEESSRSSNVFERCLAMPMPILSIDAIRAPSIACGRTPEESTKMFLPCRYFRIPSAIGERMELWVQQNSTLPGRLVMPPSRLHVQRADQREQP